MRKALALLLLSFAMTALGGEVAVKGMRLWVAPDYTRLVFDTSGPVDHRIFGLSNPDRLVIDIKDARLATALPSPGPDKQRVQAIRAAARGGKDLRVVIDLREVVNPRSFLLRPNHQYGDRLVVDLYDKHDEGDSKAQPKVTLNASGERDVVVAVDAGHGGEDPGAEGTGGTQEKNVTLSIARRLAALVNRETGMHAVLVRDGDYYVGLRQRMEIARRHKADLFVSIHADACNDPTVTGATVYTLSRRGASSEAARWLAERENSADLIGGVSLDDKDDVLASVLLDLSQTAAIEASSEVAHRVLRQLRDVGAVHDDRVQRAGFVVLKSPDIPSLLVETAYITNRSEERKLNDAKYQRELAGAIMAGVRNYFRANPPPGTRLAALAERHRVILRGDTLSGIAHEYQVSTGALRDANGLTSDQLQVGQVLVIPES